MLEALKKKLGITPVEKDAEMQEETKQAAVQEPVTDPVAAERGFVVHTFEAPADAASYHQVVTAAAHATAQVETLTAQLAAALEANAKMSAVVAEVEAAKAAALAETKATKMAARKALVVDSIGDAKADAFLAATDALDDTAFAAVHSALAGSVHAEANTTFFKEVGVDEKADATKVAANTETQEMIALKKKYQAAQPANK